jgi:thimet oligopeptidase
VLACALTLAPILAGAKPDPLHIWVGGTDPAALQQWVDGHLASARADLEKLKAVRGKRTVTNTVQPFDDAQNELAIASYNIDLLSSLGRSAAVREQAQALSQKFAAMSTDLGLDPEVHKALSKVTAPAKDPATRFYLERTLQKYRLAGVNQKPAVRDRLRVLKGQMDSLAQAFFNAPSGPTPTVTATRAELAGLPEDYIARHQPDATGTYRLTTDDPDATPVLNFGENADLRRRMFLAVKNIGFPANRKVVMDLLAVRQEIANLLGYSTYADLATADMLMGSPRQVKTLFEHLEQATRPACEREYQEVLAFARRGNPALASLSEADDSFWLEQYRRTRFGFDAQSVRPYFPYSRVEAGILDTAAKIFHVSFRAVQDAPAWDPSVTLYDVLDQGQRIGRIYLDMHPREGKANAGQCLSLVPAAHGRQLPEGILNCSFSGGSEGDPGLMDFSEVVTFFHEFGHLMHLTLSHGTPWAGQGFFSVEGDFLEAPSQMFEEFIHSGAVLAPFARHYQTGEPLPASLLERLNSAQAFARGYWVERQLCFADFALAVHDRPAAMVDLDGLQRDTFLRHSPFQWVEGNHMYANFSHLFGMGANYYAYLLDKVIALDFFAQFDKANLLEGPTAMRFRRAVLAPGATRPAKDLIKAFLDREQNMDAFRNWVEEALPKDGGDRP